jgi:hypothetical protein
MNIDIATVLVVCTLITCLGTLGGWVFKLSGRLAMSDSRIDIATEKAERAALTAQALRVALDQNERDLVDHRVAVAREYVSNQTVAALEGKLIAAVDKLGDRLDALFSSIKQ